MDIKEDYQVWSRSFVHKKTASRAGVNVNGVQKISKIIQTND